MSPRREREPLQKHTLNLFQGDFDRLRALHGILGAGKVIREMVRAHLSRVEDKVKVTLTKEAAE